MAKTLRTLTRPGWTTKPAPDLPENALTAAEVDQNFLEVWDRATASSRVFNVSAYGAVPSSSDQSEGIQEAIDACATAGGGVVYIPAGVYTIDNSLVLKTGVMVAGDGPSATTLKLGNGRARPVFVCENASTTGITDFGISDLLVDGNKAGNSTGYWSNILIHNSWRGVFVRLYSHAAGRPDASDAPGGLIGSGEGLRFLRGGKHRVYGGRFTHCEYEGLKVRDSFQNVFVGCEFHNNSRAGIQFAMYRANGDSATPEFINQDWNLVTGCTVSHDTGIPATPGAPYCSGFAFHGCRGVRLVGNMVDGTSCGIDMHEYADDNVISNNTFKVRPQDTNASAAGIQIWDFASAPTSRNVITDNTIHLLSTAPIKRALIVNQAQHLRFERNRFYAIGAATWSVEVGNTSNNCRFVDNEFPSGTTMSYGAGLNNTHQWRNGDSIFFRKSSGDTVDLVAPVFTEPPALDDDTVAIVGAIEATDAGVLDAAIKNAIDAFVLAGKADGWWARMTGVYGFVGGTANSHAINWKDPTGTAVTWTGSIAHTSSGVDGNGGYGNSGVTAASALIRNNLSLGFYCNTAGANTTLEAFLGAGVLADSGAVFMSKGSADNKVSARLVAASSLVGTDDSLATTTGHWLAQRTGSATSELWRNNTAAAVGASGLTAASNADPIAANLMILSRGGGNIPFSGRLALAYWGQSLDSSQRSSMHAAVLALQTALGRAA